MPTFLYLPTGLTFSDIREGLPPQSLPALNQYLQANGKPTVAIGDDNPLVLKLNDFDMGGAAFLRGATSSDHSKCGPISQIGHIPMAYVQLIVGVGGELTGFPVFFELTAGQLDDEIPESFPDRVQTEIDPDDPETVTQTVRTWRTWIGGGHEPVQIGDKWYRSNSNPFSGGSPIPASAWAFAGLIVKTAGEFKALQNGGP